MSENKVKKIKTEKEYLSLIEEALKHDRLYYEKCQPIISDYEYDLLIKEIEQFEKEYPQLISLKSPTKKIGEVTSKGFKQYAHENPMLSLANTYSEKEIEDFLKRVQKLLEKKEINYCLELKIDGTAVSLRYEKGKLIRALTRGNGKVGDDITNNIKTIKTVPLHLSDGFPPLLEVRGEVFMDKKSFLEINQQREEEGLEVFANPRNAAAGSLKMLDPKAVAKRKLNIVCYGVAAGEEKVSTQFEIHHYLKKLGLPISQEKHFAKVKELSQILQFAERINQERKELVFEIDGIVIKVDNLRDHQELGATGKSPRFAVAYKFAPEQAFTKINDITVQVGRTGVLTPVAELEPVELAGSTISRSTLHNENEIERKDIRIGDWVTIEKGGDVIPKVVAVDLKKRSKQAFSWKMPKICPVCGTAVVHVEKEVAIRCPNPKCYGRKLRRLTYFASKKAMDIDHLGEKVIRQLVDKNLVSIPSDIYKLTYNDLALLEGFKDKAINNLLRSIEASKKCRLDRFIMGMEIKYVGSETAEILAEEAQDLDTLMKMGLEDLLQIEGVGEKVAYSIVEYFQDSSNLEEIEKILMHGVKPQWQKQKKISHHLFSHKFFVLTGTLPKYTREEVSLLIKERGGKISNSVSKKIDYVLAGEDPGSKYDKAQALKIKILSEKEFEKLL